MGLSSNKNLLTSNVLFLSNSHQYQSFKHDYIEVKLPTHQEIKLFIFNPSDYPYMWLKYVEGLTREYTRIGASSVLDLKALESPGCVPLAMLAIADGDVVAGVRLHQPIAKPDDSFIIHEMEAGNSTLLKKYIKSWIPEKVIEPKGVWVQSTHSTRKVALGLMARAAVYGALIMEARYLIYSFPQNMKKTYAELGMHELDNIGCVPYPNDSFKTSCGFFDMQTITDRAHDRNLTLLGREWPIIHQNRIIEINNNQSIYLPIILDEKNSFHMIPIESMQMDSDYKKISHIKDMCKELKSTHQKDESYDHKDNSRWILYPWRKTALKILAPSEFRELHTNRNKNKITADEQEKLLNLRIGIAGLSTGHAIAHTLAMEGLCGHLKLADFDVLETSNLNRVPASLLDIGLNKAVITARRVAELNPYITIDVFEEGIKKNNIENFVNGLDIIIDECDSLDIKLQLREAAAKHGIPVLMSTSDLGMIDIERYDQNHKQQPFHGLVDATAEEMKDLSNQDKAGYGLGIVEGDKISTRLAASMTEIGNTLKTWPQLASDVTQGAAIIATAVRRIGIGKPTPSCRARIDMDSILQEATVPHKTKPIDPLPEKPDFCSEAKSDMLLAAKFAPSGGNVQPWNIYWENNKLHFEIDRERTSALDVNWRASMVAIGAACFNAEIVAAHYELSGNMTFFPTDTKKSDLVAIWTKRKQNTSSKKQAIAGLFEFLMSRITNRAIGNRKPLSTEFITKLDALAFQHPVSLHLLTEENELEEYGEVLAESARLRYLCSHLHKEMMAELSWPGKDSLEEGIDIRTLGLDNKDLNVMSVIQREDVMEQLAEWDAGYALGDYNRDRIRNAAATVVVGTTGQTDTDYLNGGRAVQHLWLLAEQEGLAVQPVSPIFLYANKHEEICELMQESYVDEVTALKEKFTALLKMGANTFPALTLNLSYATRPSLFSLRRK